MGFFGDLWDLGTKNTNFDAGAPFGAIKQVGGQVVDAAKSPGYDTAAQGAKEAQAYLQQLSQTAWDRQMQGLQGALGQFQGYDALKSQLIPSHGGQGGGGLPGGPPPGPPPSLPPPGGGIPPSTGPAIEGRSGVAHFGGAGSAVPGPSVEGRSGISHFGGAGPPVAQTGYGPPPGAMPQPAPAMPQLPPPAGAPTALPPPGGTVVDTSTPNILNMLSAMTRSGRGHF